MAHRGIVWQCGIVFLAGIIAFLVSTKIQALALLLGGLANILPHLFVVIMLFKKANKPSSGQALLGAFYQVEIIKYGLMVVLLVLLFKLLSAQALSVLTGFLLAQLSIFLRGHVFNDRRTHH